MPKENDEIIPTNNPMCEFFTYLRVFKIFIRFPFLLNIIITSDVNKMGKVRVIVLLYTIR